MKTRFDGFDDKITSLYARGMTANEIQGHLEEIYGVEVSPEQISTFTDGMIEEVRSWQGRPLAKTYVILNLNVLVAKVLLRRIAFPPIVRILELSEQIAGYGLNLLPQFKLLQPAGRNRVDTRHQSEYVAGNGAGTVAVTAVIDRQQHAAREFILPYQRAVERNSQRFFPHPAAAHPLDDFRRRRQIAGAPQRQGLPDGRRAFLVIIVC
jgi:hypothetical protein